MDRSNINKTQLTVHDKFSQCRVHFQHIGKMCRASIVDCITWSERETSEMVTKATRQNPNAKYGNCLTGEDKRSQCRVHFQRFGNLRSAIRTNIVACFVIAVGIVFKNNFVVYRLDQVTIRFCSFSAFWQAPLLHQHQCYCLDFGGENRTAIYVKNLI